jgi:hypothetical protein
VSTRTSRDLSESCRKLIPTDEEIKPLDEISRKWHAQKLRILDDEPPRTRIGKILDFFSPSFYSLSVDFAHAVQDYDRIKPVMQDALRDYDRHPDPAELEHVEMAIMSFHDVVRRLNDLYYQAVGEHRVDEGLGKQVEELTAKSHEIQHDLDDARRRIIQLETYMRIHGLNPDGANDTIVSSPDE